MKPFSQRSVYFQNYGLNPLILLKHFVYSVSNFRAFFNPLPAMKKSVSENVIC